MLSRTLGPRFSAHSRHKSLHRIPHGSCIEGTRCRECLVEGPNGSCWSTSTTCGVASPAGYIVLMDDCLDFPSSEPGPTEHFRGGFYQGVPHEIAHQTDFVVAAEDWDRYSETNAAFMDISGWHTIRETDPDTGDTSMRWAVEEGKEGFVREYAGTSPAEDFAESTAWVRYAGNAAKRASPLKSVHLGALLFGGRTFDDDGLIAGYAAIGARGIGAEIPSMVEACVRDHTTGLGAEPGPTVRPLTIEMTLAPALKACIDRSFERLETRAVAELKRTELEACGFLTAERDLALRQGWERDLASQVNDVVDRQQEVAELAAALRELRARLARRIDPREAFVNCFRSRDTEGRPDHESCYERVMGAAFDHHAAGGGGAPDLRPAIGEESLALERARWLAERTHADAGERAAELYRAMFAGADEVLAGAASDRWRECLASPAGTLDAVEGVVLTQPFTGGNQFIAAHVLNCVNARALEDVDAARDDFTGDLFRIDHPEAKAFVQGVILLPRYTAALQALAEEAARRERAQILEQVPALAASAEERMLSDRAWIAGASSVDDALSRCSGRASAVVAELAAQQSVVFPQLFHTFGDAHGLAASRVCQRIRASAAFRTEVERQIAQRWQEALGRVDELFYAHSVERADYCWTQYRRRHSAADRASRRTCMRNRWDHLRARTFESWRATPDGQRFASRNDDVESHLRRRKEPLLQEAVRRMENRP
ncbi:MAG: hypothetical protein IT285_15590 [Bdellovibrionales bacterium]|nr:hypothetical protein [Bdellovibrionales bacterium]